MTSAWHGKFRPIIFASLVCVLAEGKSLASERRTSARAKTAHSCKTSEALSTCLKPKPEFIAPEATNGMSHYAADSYRYFLSMATHQKPDLPSATESEFLIGDFQRPLQAGEWNPVNKWFKSTTIHPRYSPLVIRYEFPPWLLTTGYGKETMRNTNEILRAFPTDYKTIDCRSFDVQPFGRCHVVFLFGLDDKNTPVDERVECPIYEEFTFNDAGEISFIEAWSDHPSYLPMDMRDYWAEGPGVKRLSTAVPGLGRSDGLINPNSKTMWAAATTFDSTFAAPSWDIEKQRIGPFKSMLLDINGHIGETPILGGSITSFWYNWAVRIAEHGKEDFFKSCNPPTLPNE